MDLLMNGLLMAATLFAGGYCWVLGRRVQDLKSLDRGLGGSIVTLTRQIELARTTLEEARGASAETRTELDRLIGKADAAANQLKLLIAAAPTSQPVQPAAYPLLHPSAPEPVSTAPVSTAPVSTAPVSTAPISTPPVSQVRSEPAPMHATPSAAMAPRPALRPLSLADIPDLATLMRAAEPRLPEPKPLPDAASHAVQAMNLAEVPKPRALAPVENPLRRAKGSGANATAEEPNETAILDALSTLAGGMR